ncbi:MAG TPA: flagellar biosynthetic protein FliR [Anaeromyxobacteraceae bacterium]|nr:flagellar biosynthetic protein FliR [Anaeromyxobacteraceae bacterium]
MTLPVGQAWALALLLFRTAGLVLAAPVLSAKVVPVRVRLALALLLAFAAWSGAGAAGAAPPEHLGGLIGSVAAETALGVTAGLAARFILLAALMAGQLAGQSMGLGFAALVDPTSGAESNPLSELVYIAAQAGAVALGIHREAVAWLARSAIAFPPGATLTLRERAVEVVWQASGATALGARLALPMLAAVLLGHVLMAGLSRTAPQLNLGTLGFSIAVFAGGAAFYLVAPAAAELAARAAVTALAPR